MEKKIGFIGLGSMGLNMAKNLINEGYHLRVYNRTMSKADELGIGSITKCSSPAEAADGVDVIITMLSEDEVLKETVLGAEGILKKLPIKSLHISMSTVSPDTSQMLAKAHHELGTLFLAAPVFGRPEAAAARQLRICLSGDKQVKEMAKPILDCLGQAIFDFGEGVGSANVVKIAGNFMILASMETMAEAYTLAEKNGLDRLKVAEFFGSTLFNTPVYQNYGKLIASKQYEPVGFKSKLGYKDARLAFKLSQQSETPMPIATVIHNRLLASVAKGWGETDWVEGVARGVTEDAGV